MSKFEDRVLEKLDKISGDVTDLKVVNAEQSKDIARNADGLDAHMEQTKLVRKEVKVLEEKLELQKRAVNKRFVQIEEPAKFFKTGKKYLLSIGTICGALYGIYRYWNVIQSWF